MMGKRNTTFYKRNQLHAFKVDYSFGLTFAGVAAVLDRVYITDYLKTQTRGQLNTAFLESITQMQVAKVLSVSNFCGP